MNKERFAWALISDLSLNASKPMERPSRVILPASKHVFYEVKLFDYSFASILVPHLASG